MGIARAAEGFSIFDIFRSNPRESEDEYEYDWGASERLSGRRNRAIEYQIFLEISSSYLVFVLQSYSYSSSAVAGQARI